MTASSTTFAARWLRRYTTVPQPRVRLVCLPHAGGTAQAYRTWSQSLPTDVEVLAVQYPGRHDRLAEPCATTMAELAAPIAECLEPLTDRPLVIFGHSMGGQVAYEVAVELERRRGAVVDRLIISGARNPRFQEQRSVAAMSDEELLADVRRLNESFAELLNAPDLVELLLPIIRADYQLSEEYRRPEPVRLRAPVVAIGGADDPDVPPDDLPAWSVATASKFATMTFPGGHFYLSDDEPAVVRALAALLPGAGAPAP